MCRKPRSRRVALVLLLFAPAACDASDRTTVVATAPAVAHAVVAVANDRGSDDAPLADRIAVFYPSDPHAVLRRLGFPDWWPAPDAMLTDPAGPSTVVEIDSEIDVLGEVWRTTSWAIVGNDTYDVITQWTRKLAGAGDVGAPGDHVSSATVNGVETTRYEHHFGPTVGFVELIVRRGGDEVAAGQIEVTVRQLIRSPPSVSRVVAGVPSALLDALPASPALVPRGTQILASAIGRQQRSYRIELSAPRSEAASVRAAVEAWAAAAGATVGHGGGDDFDATGGRLSGDLADVMVSAVSTWTATQRESRDEFATRVVVQLRLPDA